MSTKKYVESGKVEVVRCTYKWVINNFCICDCQEVGKKIKSPLFTTAAADKEVKWRLCLYPRGATEEVKDCMSLFLVSYNELNVTAQFSAQVFSKNEQISTFDYGCQTFVFKNKQGFGQRHFLKRSLIIDEINNMPLEEYLTIICDISLDLMNTRILKHSRDIQTKDLLHRKLKELDRLENLLEDGKLSDVTLSVDGEIFKAHKCILASKSLVFAAMFEHPMKEKVDNEVEIKEIDHRVFRELLRFIYAGRVNEIENVADGLLAAADRYSLEGLKVMCEETLFKNLSTLNAVEYLKFAELYNAPKLKKQIIDFIVLNAKEMLTVPEYKSIGDIQSSVVFEVIRALTLHEFEKM